MKKTLFHLKRRFYLPDMRRHVVSYSKEDPEFKLDAVYDCAPVVLTSNIEKAVEFIKNKSKSIIAEKPKTMEGIVGTPKVRLLNARKERVIVKIKVNDFI